MRRWYVRSPVAERIRAWGVVGTVPRAAAAALVVFSHPLRRRHRRSAARVGGVTGARRPSARRSTTGETSSRTLLNGLTFAGLLFIVASGFSLIFGLMRVVNMAHGSFYLLGGYIAYEVQQSMTGQGFSLQSSEVTTWEWVYPALVACARGRRRRADRAAGVPALEHGAGAAPGAHHDRDLGDHRRPGHRALPASRSGGRRQVRWQRRSAWPGRAGRTSASSCRCSASTTRSPGWSCSALGVMVGVCLWLWLYRTRTGMVIRAGVDDRQMTSALGVNIQLVFAIAFVVGSALAAFGGVVGASQGNVALGTGRPVAALLARRRDHRRHGIALGAAAGSLLYGLVFSFAAVVPADDRERVLHAVLDRVHVRPAGPRARLPAAGAVREARVSGSTRRRPSSGVIGVGAARARGRSRSAAVQRLLGRRDPHPDAPSRDRRGQPDLPLRLRRHDLARADGAHGHRRLTCSGTWSRRAGRAASPRDSRSGGIRPWRSCSRSSITTRDRARLRCPGVAELRHLLPDAHAHVRGDRQLLLRVGDAVRRLLADRRHQPSTRRRSSETSSPIVTASTTSRWLSRSSSTLLIRYVTRTPFGIAFAGIRDEPVRMASLGYAVPAAPDARVRLRSVHRLAGRDPLCLVERPDRAAGPGPRSDHRSAHHRGHRRPRPHRGCLDRRLRVHRHQQLRRRTGSRPEACPSSEGGSTRSSGSSSSPS